MNPTDQDMIPAVPFLRTALDTRFDLWAWIRSDFLPATVVGPIDDPEATQVYRDRRQLFDGSAQSGEMGGSSMSATCSRRSRI